jgi:hypothetical protein
MLQPDPKKKYVPTAKEKKNLEDASSNKNMRPPFTPEERKKMPKVGNMGSAKSGKSIKKAKAGGSFAKLAPPYDKATFADKIAGATKNKAKSGKTIKKAQTGDKLYPTSGVGGKDMPAKNGKSMKKCKYGCK